MPPSAHSTRRLASIAALGGIAIASLLIAVALAVWPDRPANLRTVTVVNDDQDQRQLMLDPKTVEEKLSFPVPGEPLTVTVYVSMNLVPHASSFFQTEPMPYSTGRVKFNVVEHGKMIPTRHNNANGPCIAIGHHAGKRWKQNDYLLLKKNYPDCKSMNTNDEKCEAPPEFDFRQYLSILKPTSYYMPLGFRYDAWLAYQKIQQRPDFVVKPPSQRKYAFNAMISLSTNWERQDLAKMLEAEEKKGSGLETFVAMQNHWTSVPKLNTEAYMDVLLESTFTLTPTGHNPECFRQYEAIEAGSIPVMANPRVWGKCRDAMKYWNESPAIFLDSWEDLYPTIKKLMEDPVALDAKYVEMREWYDNFMSSRIAGFEDILIDSYVKKRQVLEE